MGDTLKCDERPPKGQRSDCEVCGPIEGTSGSQFRSSRSDNLRRIATVPGENPDFIIVDKSAISFAVIDRL